MWAVGCIFGELLNHSPLFPGQNDIDQLYNVISILGTPSIQEWPELESLPDFGKISFSTMNALGIDSLCPDASQEARDLLNGFLIYRSTRRISAGAVSLLNQALLDPYFFNRPLPSHHLELPFPTKSVKEQFDTEKPLDLTPFFRDNEDVKI